MESNKVKDR